MIECAATSTSVQQTVTTQRFALCTPQPKLRLHVIPQLWRVAHRSERVCGGVCARKAASLPRPQRSGSARVATRPVQTIFLLMRDAALVAWLYIALKKGFSSRSSAMAPGRSNRREICRWSQNPNEGSSMIQFAARSCRAQVLVHPEKMQAVP